ncbi:MAG: hypothetical protein RL385_3233, partial [Pseudomonadota bacterium]
MNHARAIVDGDVYPPRYGGPQGRLCDLVVDGAG